MNRIAIHGLPRTGTTWAGEIINSCPDVCYKFQPLFSYAMKGFLGPTSSAEEIAEFFDRLSQLKDDFCDQVRQRAEGELPTFRKTLISHVAYKEVRYHHVLHNLARQDTQMKFVLVVRDPVQAIASWLAAPREFRSDVGWNVEQEWRYAPKKNLNNPESFYGYEKWREAMLLFYDLKQRFEERVFVLNYALLAQDPFREVQALFRFLGLALTEQTEAFLSASRVDKSKTPYGVFRGREKPRFVLEERYPNIVTAIRNDLAASAFARLLDNSFDPGAISPIGAHGISS